MSNDIFTFFILCYHLLINYFTGIPIPEWVLLKIFLSHEDEIKNDFSKI